MKKYFMIPVLLLAFILFSAKRCDDDAEENRLLEEEALVSTMDSVKKEFEADYLNEASLFAFQEKARQKLMDYSDYMNLAGDTSLEPAFRDQATVMIQNLFYLHNVPEFSQPPGCMIFIDSIRVLEPLQRRSDFGYQGVLGFNMVVRECDTCEKVISGHDLIMIEMIAVKTIFSFGKETLNIWKVFLGDIFVPYHKKSNTKTK